MSIPWLTTSTNHRKLSELSAILGYLADDLQDTFDDTGVILHEFSVFMPRLNRLLEGISPGDSGEDFWQ